MTVDTLSRRAPALRNASARSPILMVASRRNTPPPPAGRITDDDGDSELVPRAATAIDAAASGDDQQLVAAAKSGDTSAWAALYQANFRRLYRHVGYLVGDPTTAEDLTQEIFARALASLPRFDGRSAFSTWLYGIASNTVYKHWRSTGRKRRAYAAYELTPPPAGHDPEAAHLTQQRARALRAALDDLPPQQREAFVLVDLEQLPPRQAADRLGITTGNLAVRASRARARIRKTLADAGWIASKAEVSS